MPAGVGYPNQYSVIPTMGAGPAGAPATKKKKKKNPVRTALTQNVADANAQVAATQGATPQSTAFYQAGQGQLADMMRRLTQRDTQASAMRGLGGTEFDIATAARRAGTQAGQSRELLASSEQMLQQDRQLAIQRLLQSLGLLSGFATNQRQISSQNRAAWTQGVGTIVGSIPG